MDKDDVCKKHTKTAPFPGLSEKIRYTMRVSRPVLLQAIRA